MSLTGRFSALFLAALAAALLIFSTALWVSARVYLERRVRDRVTAALAILAAAAEIHSESVEWEPHERSIELGRESGANRLRWMVLDDQGRRVDHSSNLDDAPGLKAVLQRLGPLDDRDHRRLVDAEGASWRVARRVLRPEDRPGAGPAEGDGTFAPYLVLVACVPLGPTEATLAALAGLLAALSAGIWVASALVCRGLSRGALRPLSRMVESARGLDASEPGWSLAEAGTGDELDDLGHAFNELLERLQVAYERQRRFSGDASHQLRTPLTILIGQLQVALRYERSGEDYRRALTSALGRAEQLARIVEALLFLSRPEAEAGLPGVEPIELNAWAAEHLAGRPKAPGEPAIVHEGGTDPIGIRAHPGLLGQLLDNLLDNAVKYGKSESNAEVIVETRREGDEAVLSVADRGPGIAPEDLPHVFDPFYRSPQARRRGTVGVGLGLAIVRRIATACGGAVSATSGPGRGTRFEARFPIAPEPSASIDRSEPLAVESSR